MIKHISSVTEEKILDTFEAYSENSSQVLLISGFITIKGFKTIINNIKAEKIKRIIVGVFTENAKEAFEYIEENHPKIELYIYKFLGHEDYNSKSFFSPILHAKIIAGYKNKKIQWAYTGSANITEFALIADKNIESGVFIKEKNKELECINETIKKINSKNSLIDYKLNKEIFFVPDERFIYKIDDIQTESIANTYLIVINEELQYLDHNLIGIYFNKINHSLNRNDKILLYFLKNRKLILNKVQIVGNIFSEPENPVNFYIENLDNQGFITKETYLSETKADTFITVEKIDSNSSTEKLMEKLDKLFETAAIKLMSDSLELKNHAFLDKVIYKQHPSKFKSDSINYLKNNKMIDISKLEIEKGQIITLNDLHQQRDNKLFNEIFSLTKKIIKEISEGHNIK
jgi:hypothetical protein